eukprot:3509673-Heterocapsa_arctica.AAC.1
MQPKSPLAVEVPGDWSCDAPPLEERVDDRHYGQAALCDLHGPCRQVRGGQHHAAEDTLGS